MTRPRVRPATSRTASIAAITATTDTPRRRTTRSATPRTTGQPPRRTTATDQRRPRHTPPYTPSVPTTPPIKAARGVRDILPAERAAFAVVEHAAREQARGYGYQDVELPIIEPVELIERGVGGDTDVARKELYRLEPHGDPGDPPREIRTRPPRFRGDPGDGDRDSASRLVLRPEATASMVRAYFQGGLNQGPQPVRLFTIGPFFRHDKPQHLRYRQFVQFDVEVIGDDSPAYDAEVIELTWGWLERMGIRHVSLELNSIGDENCRPQYLRALQDYYRPLKDQLDPDCRRRVEENPLRLFDCKEPQCQPLMAAAPRITDHLCGPCAAAFEEVKSLLGAAGLEYRLNPGWCAGSTTTRGPSSSTSTRRWAAPRTRWAAAAATTAWRRRWATRARRASASPAGSTGSPTCSSTRRARSRRPR